MPQLPSINRTSLTTNLQARYESSSRLGGDIGTAKFVGTSRAVTDMINGTARGVDGRDVHSRNFVLGGRVPGFTDAAKSYAKDVLKHNNTQYYG
jgi:hypothetical protein